MVNVARFKMFKGPRMTIQANISGLAVRDEVSDHSDDEEEYIMQDENKHLTIEYSPINCIAHTTCDCGEQEQLSSVTEQMKVKIVM